MMIDIQVFGQNELVEHLSAGRQVLSHCISITNPEGVTDDDPQSRTPDEIRSAFEDILTLKFWDENDTAALGKFSNKKLVDRSDIESVLRFVEQSGDTASGYTIHCWRGVSRSTSVALGILQYFLQDETSASEKLIAVRRNAMPLKRSVLLFDDLLGSNLADFKNTVFRARMKAMRAELRSR